MRRLLLIAVLATGCGDSDADPVDAAVVDAPVITDDAGPDLYEPNDTPQTAVVIEAGEYDMSIAPVGDVDYVQFVLAQKSDVTVEMRIHGAADLDIELFSISDLDTPIAWARGAATVEKITRTEQANGPLDPGVYVVRVGGFNDQGTAAYSLTLAVAPSN